MSKLKAYKGDVTIPVYGTIADAEVYLKYEADKVIAHHKYKRCLAMAKWCYAKWDDTATKYYKSVWYRKWEVKWLELAEKFKEVK